MQKKYIILHFILTLFSLLLAGAPDTLWTRTYGGELTDGGYCVQQTNDGGFIISGYTNSFGAGGYDVYLIRINSNGDTLWTRTYGGIEKDEGWSVQETSDGGFIIAGYTGPHLDEDVYLIRTEPNGDTLWTKTYGGPDPEIGRSVQQTRDEGFIVAGWRGSPGIGYEDIYLIRTNSEGNTLWEKIYSLDDYDLCFSIHRTNDDGFILAGSNESGVWLLRTKSNGDTLWTKTYGGDQPDWGESVQQTSDGGFVITGWTYSFGVTDYYSDIYLLKTDQNGDTLWAKTYGGSKNDGGNSVQQTSDGGFIIAGKTESFGAGSCDIYLVRTNSRGDTLWTKTFGGEYNDEGFSVQQTEDKGYVVVGQIELTGGWNEVYLIRLEKDSTNIQEDIPNNYINLNDFIISNNNGNISIRYSIPYSTHVKLEAYDIKGKLVKVITDKFIQKGSYSVNWDIKRFGSGVYFIKLSTNGSAVSEKITLIK